MAKISGAEVLVRSLRAEGVDTLFGLPGNAIFALYEACDLDGNIRLINTRHEGAAVFAAEAYARVKRQPGVVAVTEGPGFANAMPGLAHAQVTGSPVLVISGMCPSYLIGKIAMQELPAATMAAAMTKWSAQVPTIDRIPEYVAVAFRRLRAGREGPVHLAIPVDLMEGLIDEDAICIRPSSRSGPTAGSGASPTAVSQIADLLASAQRPVVIAGSSAYWTGADAALKELVELTGTPFSLRDSARGMIPDDHPLAANHETLGQADLIVLIGQRTNDHTVRPLPKGARLVQVDSAAEDIGHNVQLEVGVAGDPAVFAQQLLEEAKTRQWPNRGNSWPIPAPIPTEDRKPLENAPGALHPLSVFEIAEQFADKTTIRTYEHGNFGFWLQGWLKVGRACGLMSSDGPGQVGVGIPFALGAAAAEPGTRVICYTGDLAVGFHALEFETAVRNRLPFVAIVGNDSGMAIEEHYQTAMFGEGRNVGSQFSPARYDLLVQALGGYGERVERLEDLAPAIERAFASGKPACIDVTVSKAKGPLTNWTVNDMTIRLHDHAAGIRHEPVFG